VHRRRCGREGVNIFHPLRLPRLRRHTADANTQRNTDARGPTRKWAKHQFAINHAIEAGPVAVRQEIAKQRRHIGHVGNAVRLACGQRIGGVQQIAVEVSLADIRIGREIEHGAADSGQRDCRKAVARLILSA